MVWFPFFFVVVMCWLFSLTFSAPQPHDVKIAVATGQGFEAPPSTVSSDEGRYRWFALENPDEARVAVRQGAAAAAVVCPPQGVPSCELLFASASGRGRALSVTTDLRSELESTGRTVTVDDVVPLAPG